MPQNMTKEKVEHLFEQLVEFHERKLLTLAQRVIPHVTSDDLLQPNDFPELENHPEFRYEEGLLAGIRTAQMAFRALEKASV
jgi:hypothetical protein